jgi:hypothetical protein
VPALLILLLLAALVTGGALSGLLPGVGDGAGTASRDAENAPIEPAAITLFDPGGSGSEDGSDLPNLLDGDRSSTWQSVGYNTPEFGGLKEGLGFYLDLGDEHVVERVTLRTDTPGLDLEIRVADEPADSPAGWEEVGAAADVAETVEIELADAVTTRYLLVWVTGSLQPDGARNRMRFSELAVEGAPA